MTPIFIVLLAGLAGGLVLAFLFRGGPARVYDETGLEPPSTDVINMARIRVRGIGGLGMVAISVAVAIFVPRIRVTMIIALLLGGTLAAVLIALRRRERSLPSIDGRGDDSLLSLDRDRAVDPSRPSSIGGRQDLAAVASRP
jgi:hypothetical protein